MKRIFYLFELMALVFPKLSVAMPPIFSCVSSSSEPEPEYSDTYELEFCAQGHSTRTWMYFDFRIFIEAYDDTSKFKFKLKTRNGDLVFQDDGRNANIVFLLGKKMKIYVKDGVSYILNFRRGNQANFVANQIISTDSERYKKCQGNHAYKLEKLYKRSTTGTLTYLGENWCVFKIRKDDMTKFMIRWIAPIEDHRKVLCVFRSENCNFTPLTDTNNKLELGISFDNEILHPKYVLETSTLDKIQQFFVARS